MKSEYRESVEKLIHALTIGQDEAKICFFKYYSAFEINDHEIQKLMRKHDLQCTYRFHEFAGNEIQDAYCPFMNLARDLFLEFYPEKDVMEFLAECEVYPLQRDMFAYYIEQGSFRRTEDIMPREVAYEQERFIKSLQSILAYIIKDHKVVLVLNKLHLAQESTVLFVEKLVWDGILSNLAFIVTYNEAYNENIYFQRKWQSLKNRLDESEYIIKCDDESEDREDLHMSVFEPDMRNLKFYMDKINDMMNSLAFRQAEYYMDIIYHAVENNKSVVGEKARIRVLLLFAMIYIYKEQNKQAYVLCNKVRDSEYLYQDIDCQYNYNYALAMIYMFVGQKQQALAVIESTRSLVRNMGDEDKLVRLDMLNIVVLLNDCQDSFHWDKNLEFPYALIESAERNNQKNHLAYAELFGYMNEEIIKIQNNKDYQLDQSKHFIRGMETAREIDNIELQMLAWQVNATAASSSGQFEGIIRYYSKCMELMEGLDRPWDEVRIYNGSGYNCIIHEHYDMANDYFLKALNISVQLEDTAMLLEVIYNMAVNCLSAGAYQLVIDYITVILRMMTIEKIERIRPCNRSKLYGMLIVAYVEMGRIYDGKRFFAKVKTILAPYMEENTDCEGWEDDIFLYYMSAGMLYSAAERYKEAKDMFAHARFLWNNFSNNQVYVYAKFVEEEAKVYAALGDEEKYIATLEQGIVFMKNQNLAKGKENLQHVLEGKDIIPVDIKCKLSEEELKNILKVVSASALRKELENKNKVLDFYENWVELLNQDCDSIEEMISEPLSMMQNNFKIDNLVYVDVDNNGDSRILYKDMNIDFNHIRAKMLTEYMNQNRKKIVLSRFEISYKVHKELVDIFPKDTIASMVAIPFVKNDKITSIFIASSGKYANFTENVVIFSDEDANVFRTAFQQLLDAIDREKIKQQLENSSVTDILTTLKNRLGMKQYLEEQFKVNDEYGEKSGRRNVTLLYMDLDNFKYCNDHFGHEAGDAVLIAFSRMLEKIVENDGFIVRYGGDEFLIILMDHTEEDGRDTAERILEELERSEGFSANIEKVYKKPVSIASANQLGCSIGIAHGRVSTVAGVTTLIQRADDALYHVKKSTKHDYYVWRKPE